MVPLRQRKEDIPVLAKKFLEDAATKLKCNHPGLTQENVITLQSYDWPGNVRELQNVIERAVITSRCEALRIELPGEDQFVPFQSAQPSSPFGTNDGSNRGAPTNSGEIVPDEEMKRRESGNILAALEHANWKIHGKDGAAELLGVKSTTLASRIKKMGLKKDGYPFLLHQTSSKRTNSGRAPTRTLTLENPIPRMTYKSACGSRYHPST